MHRAHIVRYSILLLPRVCVFRISTRTTIERRLRRIVWLVSTSTWYVHAHERRNIILNHIVKKNRCSKRCSSWNSTTQSKQCSQKHWQKERLSQTTSLIDNKKTFSILCATTGAFYIYDIRSKSMVELFSALNGGALLRQYWNDCDYEHIFWQISTHKQQKNEPLLEDLLVL
jgi:hypothetical protein